MNAVTTTITTASREWASRPTDQRFTSLPDLHIFVQGQRDHSRGLVVSSRKLRVEPAADDEIRGLQVSGANGVPYNPTHWSFG